MQCPECSAPVTSADKFCASCGRSLLSSAPDVASIPNEPTPLLHPTPPGWLVVIVGFILSIVVIVTLHPLSIVVAIFSMIALGFIIASRRRTVQHKLVALATFAVLVLTSNVVEGQKTAREKQLHREAAQKRVNAEAERKRQEDEAFRRLTPRQHLDKAAALLKVGSPNSSTDEGLKHLAAIPPGSPENKEVNRIRNRYEAAEKRRKLEALAAHEAAAKQKTALEGTLKRMLRDEFAKGLENTLLDKGFNVDVSATGIDHTTLHMKWILVSKVVAHQFSKQADFFDSARNMGFRRFEITDGYRETWWWTLK
jgi:hypothetical protein